MQADARTWTELRPSGDAPSARHFHTCVGVGRLLVLFGGYDGARWTDDLYVCRRCALAPLPRD
jgi:hypothetical protein